MAIFNSYVSLPEGMFEKMVTVDLKHVYSGHRFFSWFNSPCKVPFVWVNSPFSQLDLSENQVSHKIHWLTIIIPYYPMVSHSIPYYHPISSLLNGHMIAKKTLGFHNGFPVEALRWVSSSSPPDRRRSRPGRRTVREAVGHRQCL